MSSIYADMERVQAVCGYLRSVHVPAFEREPYNRMVMRFSFVFPEKRKEKRKENKKMPSPYGSGEALERRRKSNV